MVLCDIIPKYLVSCHVLLGEPWCKQQGAVRAMNYGTYYQYTVIRGKREYALKSMDTIIYKAWRDERLQKKEEADHRLRELEEAKRREAKAAAIPVEANIAAPILEPVQATDVADTAATHVSADSTIDIIVVDVQPVHDDDAVEADLKPTTVSPEGGRMIRHLLCMLHILFSLLLMLSRGGYFFYSYRARRRLVM